MAHNKRILQVDFDGTLVYWDGWKGPDVFGAPLPNARQAMWILSRKYKLVCFCARENLQSVSNHLRRHGFPPMPVTNKKDPAHLCIDDRAMRFNGKWDQSLLEAIYIFQPWWEDDQQSDQVSNPCPLDDDQSPLDQTPQQPAALPRE